MEQGKIYKNLFIGFLVILLLSTIVTAIPAGEPYNVKAIDKCEGQILVKVRGSIPSNETEYEIVDCIFNGTYWICNCVNPSTITFLTENETNNQYDIVLEWYVEEKKNTQWFTNIDVGPKIKPKEEFKMPPLEGVKLIGFVIGGVVVFFTIVLFIILKWFMKEEKEIIDKPRVIETTTKKGDITDEELNDVINQYTK